MSTGRTPRGRGPCICVRIAEIRRRDSGYPEPPPQSRTCGFPASGSSVVLTFARTFTVARYNAQLLLPAVRLARVVSDPACPARVSFAGCVLPSGPSPCGRLSRPPTTMPDKTPRRHAAVSRLPGCSMFDDSTRAHAVSGLFTCSCPSPVGVIISLHPGAFGASRVLERLSSCMPRPEDSGGPPRPSHLRALRVAFQHVKTVGIRNKLISKLYQHFRERDLPYGLQDSLCTLAPSCSRLSPLRNGTNTRYGWVANPYPTGTFTRQETPSFARRDNVGKGHLPAGTGDNLQRLAGNAVRAAIRTRRDSIVTAELTGAPPCSRTHLISPFSSRIQVVCNTQFVWLALQQRFRFARNSMQFVTH